MSIPSIMSLNEKTLLPNRRRVPDFESWFPSTYSIKRYMLLDQTYGNFQTNPFEKISLIIFNPHVSHNLNSKSQSMESMKQLVDLLATTIVFASVSHSYCELC